MCDDELSTPQEEEMECVCTPKPPTQAKQLVLPCTCPYDPRFPNVNQTRRCFVNFVDYQRCVRLLGNYQGCRIFKVCYETLCPNEWISKWYEAINNGTFPVAIQPRPPDAEVPDETEPFDTSGY